MIHLMESGKLHNVIIEDQEAVSEGLESVLHWTTSFSTPITFSQEFWDIPHPSVRRSYG